MNGEEFREARKALGLTIGDTAAILGVSPDTIRRRWQLDKPGPNPIACNVMRWMTDGFRPPEWPARLSKPAPVAKPSPAIRTALERARAQLAGLYGPQCDIVETIDSALQAEGDAQ
jgi:transcriptional regulator with XRE-family HTH domain